MRYVIFVLLLFCLIPPVQASPAGYLIIPKIDLFKSVELIIDSDISPYSHFYDLSKLNNGVGYLQYLTWGTTEGGRTILVGHTPGAFSDLKELVIGDEIILGMGDNYHTFNVFNIYVLHKDDNTLFEEVPDEYELALVTCIDDNLRLIIKAK